MNWRRYFWPVIGIAAVVFSLWLLIHELRGISLDDVWAGIIAIPPRGWILAALSSVVAYASLAGYDHIALLHIGKKVSWLFVTLCSFTTYALSHNIGGSVISGAVIRYRAYGTRGLTGQDVGVLVAICWITFVLSSLLAAGLVLVLEPQIVDRFSGAPHHGPAIAAGLAMLILVGAYVCGSGLHLKPLKIGSFQLHYPALPIVARQLLIGPIELLAAAAIIFFALPAAGNPGYFVVLGVFVVSFSVAQLSHAPGGLGVFEVVFLAGLSDMDPVGVLAALLVFRLFYLIIPLLIGLCVVLFFEHSQYSRGEG
ncbi:lysylphosphatidylglycerol synthase domain-containing protein [Mesorhizobium sp. VK22B]|uniref:Lysylphosphatidylglycerol synthase domain-containing protein n=1 Tax=Mesorhizobium captivum TaxID=3072319 RepID=A0ABU4ZDP1_9HYPH|nr:MULTISPECIES: lysylphosphatidylglycerol synthase domain-containing protein [unclassified Mesorhizobium]MDX8496087.1 lysylphosphatidylglycerol synthase domain-containing protein [Mesorhizobium sp. VK22B]MDX8509238.1 lysylphosphatidylglycerol synthase domain-containing protein [Mesorhizobium sp. VK22E]